MACGVLSGKYQSYPYEGSDLALKEAKRVRKLPCESVQAGDVLLRRSVKESCSVQVGDVLLRRSLKESCLEVM